MLLISVIQLNCFYLFLRRRIRILIVLLRIRIGRWNARLTTWLWLSRLSGIVTVWVHGHHRVVWTDWIGCLLLLIIFVGLRWRWRVCVGRCTCSTSRIISRRWRCWACWLLQCCGLIRSGARS